MPAMCSCANTTFIHYVIVLWCSAREVLNINRIVQIVSELPVLCVSSTHLGIETILLADSPKLSFFTTKIFSSFQKRAPIPPKPIKSNTHDFHLFLQSGL